MTASTAALLCILSACKAEPTLERLRPTTFETPVPNVIKLNFCTDPALASQTVMKMLIIMDHSGSNALNYSPIDEDGHPYLGPTCGQPRGTCSFVASPAFGTDPTGSVRYGFQGMTGAAGAQTPVYAPGSLLDYLRTTPRNAPGEIPTKYFGLINFSDSLSATRPFTSNIDTFYQQVIADSGNGTPADNGGTNYVASLQAANSMITNDIKNAIACSKRATNSVPDATCPAPGVAISSVYVIVFLSDGTPMDGQIPQFYDANPFDNDFNKNDRYITGQTPLTDGTGAAIPNASTITLAAPFPPDAAQIQPNYQVLGEVNAINALGQSNPMFVAGVNLFTIYYYKGGNEDPHARSLLKQMAEAGNGVSYAIDSNSTLDYSKFIPPNKLFKFTLSDVLVTNSSVIWTKDGKLEKDSDGDGLPDSIETQWGSNSASPSSFGFGYSDLVQYDLSHGVACTKSAAGANRGLCTNLTNYATVAACTGLSNGSYRASDPSGMNDCEKRMLDNANGVGGPDSNGVGGPDSNGDGIPDWLEYRNNVPFQAGTPSAAASSATDGYTLYEKIKYSLPTSYPLNQILNLKPSAYNIRQTSTSTTQDCYDLMVEDLPMIGDNNLIRVDILLRSDLMRGAYRYKTAGKRFAPGTSTLIFNDWNDATEVSAGTWRQWP